MTRRADPYRRPSFDDQVLPFEGYEPQLALDNAQASFSISEARRGEYRGLQKQDYAELFPVNDEKYFERFRNLWLGELILNHPHRRHPTVFEYRKEDKAKTVYYVAVTAVEAMLLGRDYARFTADEAEEARSVIAEMRSASWEAVQYPNERWPIQEEYVRQHIDSKIKDNELLHGAGYFYASDGKSAQGKNRQAYVDKVLTTILFPVLEDTTKTANWTPRQTELTKKAVEYLLTFHGTAKERANEWKSWHGTLECVLNIKHALFSREIRKTKPPTLPKPKRHPYVP